MTSQGAAPGGMPTASAGAAAAAAGAAAAPPPTMSGVVATVQAGVSGTGAHLLAYCSACVLLVTALLMGDVALICFLFLSKALALEASVGASLGCVFGGLGGSLSQ